jgi:5-methylcytosine-specific restriction protein A
MSGKWASSTRAARLPRDWHARKAAVRKRDGDRCWVCGGYGADQIDHKVRGDDHSLANLAPIHNVPCHQRKSQQEAHAERWKYRESRPAEQHPGLC